MGINYSASPWYQSFCKTVPVCAPGARAGADDIADNLVFPNPTQDRFSFVAERAIQSMTVADEMGREKLTLGSAKAGQTITFGENLSTGTYRLNIQYDAKSRRVVKLVKIGN